MPKTRSEEKKQVAFTKQVLFFFPYKPKPKDSKFHLRETGSRDLIHTIETINGQ